MAPRTKKTGDPADSWLIDGTAAPSKSAQTEADEDFESLAPAPKQERPSPAASGGANEWLVVPEPSSTPAEPRKKRSRRSAKRKQKEAPSPTGDAEQVIEEQRAEIAELSAQVRVLQGEVQTKTKLTERVAELEAELAESKAQATVRRARRSKPTGTATAKRKTAATKATATRSKADGAKAKAPARKTASSSATSTKSRRNGKLDLNEASFEELRELGLSVTQSARLIAYRDVRGGYESLDEIDDVPGLSERTRDELKEQLKLGA